ncbi:TRAP transporter small permease [Candidimonas sp. SYP-B2681]|uniref:TRAP transporter small permease n=1 Tax=Candidimonas sp. SYP-B2681 TaxID=2497686 RepID=UPI000F86F332|nr:TRAP transporter small permease [Candidimonas sp. SYP-B2681]RTZ48060.1 TRAP transporter small permease [Candidimonas sp. SYP-B2681]
MSVLESELRRQVPAGAVSRFLAAVYRLSGILAGVSLVAIAVLTLAQIVGRNLGLQIRDADVFAGIAMAASAFLAMPSTLRSGKYIRITLLLSQMDRKSQRLAEGWCLLFGLVLVGAFAYFSVILVVQSYQFGDVSAGLLGIPLWIPQSLMATGAILLEIAFLEEAVNYVRGRPLSYQVAESGEL